MLSLVMFAILSLTDQIPPEPEGQKPPPVAIRPEDIQIPKPKVSLRNGPPRKHCWPSPHRRFTRKG